MDCDSSEKSPSNTTSKRAKRRAEKRPPMRHSRPSNESGPCTKLTTGLLATYKAINERYYARKKKLSRRCKLVELLEKVGMYLDMTRAWAKEPASLDAPAEVTSTLAKLRRCVRGWLHANPTSAYAFRVESAVESSLSEEACGGSVTTLSMGVERFHCMLELLKVSEDTLTDDRGNYAVLRGEMMGNRRYCMEKYAGGGAFSQAWTAIDTHTGERVCIKVVANRKKNQDPARREIKILKFLHERVPDSGVVRLKNHFVHCESQCLVFPHLAYDLYELLKNEKFAGVSLKLVRKFAVQILKTLAALAKSDVKLVHCDLKPENIMVVKHNQTKVNVIDFGSSCFSQEKGSMYVQSRFYRAPEVLLSIPYDMKIDVWSFGCIAFEMYTGRPLFTGKDTHDQLMHITKLLGQPNARMMKARRSCLDGTKEGNQLLKQPATMDYTQRFKNIGYTVIKRRDKTSDIQTDDTGRVIDEDLLQFTDLIVKCLDIDPKTRMTPEEALKHPFCAKLTKAAAATSTEAAPEPSSATVPAAVSEPVKA